MLSGKSRLQYRPDLAGLIEGVAKNPAKALEGAKETLEQLQQGTTGGLGDVLQGVTKKKSEDGSADGGGGLIPDAGLDCGRPFPPGNRP